MSTPTSVNLANINMVGLSVVFNIFLPKQINSACTCVVCVRACVCVPVQCISKYTGFNRELLQGQRKMGKVRLL